MPCERGVKEVLQNMIADMDITMALAGEKSVSELISQCLWTLVNRG